MDFRAGFWEDPENGWINALPRGTLVSARGFKVDH